MNMCSPDACVGREDFKLVTDYSEKERERASSVSLISCARGSSRFMKDK